MTTYITEGNKFSVMQQVEPGVFRTEMTLELTGLDAEKYEDLHCFLDLLQSGHLHASRQMSPAVHINPACVMKYDGDNFKFTAPQHFGTDWGFCYHLPPQLNESFIKWLRTAL